MPNNQPERKIRFTKFYKTMLILSAIGTSFNLYSLLSQSAGVQQNFEFSTLHGVLVIVNYAIAAASVAALMLLWNKEPLGIKLKVGSYLATIISTVIMFFISQPVIERALDIFQEQMKGQQGVTQEMIDIGASLIEPTYFIGLVSGILIAAVFCILWVRAWKSQLEYDKNKRAD
jgi:hypothetical protein